MMGEQGEASGTVGQMDLGSCQPCCAGEGRSGVGIRQAEGGARDRPE